MDTTVKIRAVCFDLDGLMFNTEHVFYEAAKELLARRNIQMSHAIMDQLIGRRPMESFTNLVQFLKLPDQPADLLAESRVIFDAMLDNHLAPMPGLLDLLGRIEQAGLPKGVATSSPRGYLEKVLGRFHLQPRFHLTLTAEDVVLGKPNPEIYLKAARTFNVEPGEMLVLEDSAAGTRAAVQAGAYAVSVPHEFTAGHDFSGTRHIIPSLEHETLLQLIG